MTNNKKILAPTPPMGWNSWICYGASVTEDEVLGNARYMAENMKQYGWEYVVCDIQWYEPDAVSSEYRNFVPLQIDEFSRLIPSAKRFPSVADGNGFLPLSEKIHEMGLKFGIHVMRGIPRQAVHANTPILGSTATARDIAQRFSVCSWNTDMYGIDTYASGAQAYYDSLMQLYASWGVDLIKVDDLCNTYFSPNDLYSAKKEIEMIHRAIAHCGRDIVLSLSPGPAPIEHAEHLAKNAQMWRMTSDFWDKWEDLFAMFERCDTWASQVGVDCWPDCDMLPLGHINIRGNEHGLANPRWTRFTEAEQKTMMSLWCLFRSPLMMGGEMRDNDDATLALLTNSEVLEMHANSHSAHQVARTNNTVVWQSFGEGGIVYLAMFNTHTIPRNMEIHLDELELKGRYLVRDMWKHEVIAETSNSIVDIIPSHGVGLYCLIPTT